MAENDFEMESVDSDLLSQVGFNASIGHGKAVFKKGGSVYGYPGCTQEEYEQIKIGAIEGSVGKTFNQLWKWKTGYYKIS